MLKALMYRNMSCGCGACAAPRLFIAHVICGRNSAEFARAPSSVRTSLPSMPTYVLQRTTHPLVKEEVVVKRSATHGRSAFFTTPSNRADEHIVAVPSSLARRSGAASCRPYAA